MKKTVAFVLALTVVFMVTFPVSAKTLSGTCGVSATWTFQNGVLTVSGTGKVEGMFVWDGIRDQVTQVVIQEGITDVGQESFCNFDQLQSVSLPDSLINLGYLAFGYCDRLSSVFLPKNLRSFYEPHVVNCAANVFSGSLLDSVKVHPDNQWFCDVDGVLFDKSMKTLLIYPTEKKATGYRVPEGVTRLGYAAFDRVQHDIFLPHGLEVIEGAAFYGASFETIELPDTVISIGSQAFANCDQMTRITIPSSVQYMYSMAFGSCEKLKTITFEGMHVQIHEQPDCIPMQVEIRGLAGSDAEIYAKRFGRCFVDTETGEKHDYYRGNVGFLEKMPTDITATVPSQCMIYSTADYIHIDDYQPELFLESNTSLLYYQEMLAFTKKLTQGCSSDYEKARKIYKWVSETMNSGVGTTDFATEDPYVYRVFKALSGNCAAYTRLTNFLLHLAGIPNATVTSYGHAWSLALTEGRWVMIDSTHRKFDLPAKDYPAILSITFSPDGQTVCIVDDLLDIKLISYGKLVTDKDTFKTITIPDFVTKIYSSIHRYKKYENGEDHVTIYGNVNGVGMDYIRQNLAGYTIAVEGERFVATHHAHKMVSVDTVISTCVSAGTYFHFRCEKCGKTFQDTVGNKEFNPTMAMKTHSYSKRCMNEELHWYECICGAKKEETKHNYTDWINGETEKVRYCQTCGYRQITAIDSIPIPTVTTTLSAVTTKPPSVPVTMPSITVTTKPTTDTTPILGSTVPTKQPLSSTTTITTTATVTVPAAQIPATDAPTEGTVIPLSAQMTPTSKAEMHQSAQEYRNTAFWQICIAAGFITAGIAVLSFWIKRKAQ